MPIEPAIPSARAAELRQQLVRNVDALELDREHRPPLYDTRCGRVSDGTAAKKLGAGLDILEPGMRGCPYHTHHAQEEMFVILEGEGSLRVAGEMLPVRSGDVVFIPAGPDYPHQFINTSAAPMKYLSISTRIGRRSASTPTPASTRCPTGRFARCSASRRASTTGKASPEAGARAEPVAAAGCRASAATRPRHRARRPRSA